MLPKGSILFCYAALSGQGGISALWACAWGLMANATHFGLAPSAQLKTRPRALAFRSAELSSSKGLPFASTK
jgi:hypothetical protein